MEYNNKVSALLLSKRIRKKVGSLYINERSYPIYIGVNTIGRNRDAIVNIKNLNVSTHHAIITALDETKVYISDINSSNGTQVNDTKLAPFDLHLLPADENSQISFGYLTGMYKHDLDPEVSSFEMTQNATQSLYLAQTQIMSNSNLHEEATQIQSLEPNDDIAAQLCDDMLDNCDAKTQYMPLINYAANEEELIEEIVMNDDEVTQVMNLNPDRSAANISEINSNGVNDSATIINETVYDDSICSKPRASTFTAEFSESSNDSIDFLQPNLKPVKVVDVHCESDSDESIVVPNRATKSRQILSDDSDTDIEDGKGWNDSDVIPATQNMSVNKSQKSSSESFKLELSELENGAEKLDVGKKFSFRKAAVILGDVSLTKILAKPDESLIDDSRKLEEIQNGGASEVAESAQKMAENVETIEEANDLAGNDETVASNEEIDLKPAKKSIGKANTSRELKVRFSDNVQETQKIDIEEDNHLEVSGDNDIYIQPTQKIVENNLDVEGEDTLEVSRGEGDEEIYFQPTQKLAGNNETIEEAINCDDSIYDKETQAIEPEPAKEIVVNLDDSDIYNKETQKMVVEDSEEEIFSRETQKLGEIASTSKENETISDESAIFTAATQKIAPEEPTTNVPIEETPIKVSILERPTQKLAAPSKLSLATRKSTRKITPSKKLEDSCSTPQNQNQPSTTHVTLRKKFPKRVSVKTEELSPVRKRTKLPSTSDEDDVSLAALVPPKIDQSFVMAEAKSKRLRRNVNNEVTDVKDLQLTVKNRNSMNITNVDLVRSTRSSKQIATNVNNNSVIVEAGTSKVEPKKRGKALQKKLDSFVAPAMVKIEKENTDVKARARRHTSVTSLAAPPVATASVPKRRFTQVSPERSRRKQRPRVVFTMFENPVMESWIRQLGGMMVDNVENCTVLITEQVKRSAKLLTAVGLGKPICSPQWIVDSRKAAEFLDPWENILIDKAAEEKWSFSLKDSLQRAQNARLLEDFRFQLLSTANLDVLKGAIEACGGKCMAKLPPKRKGTKLYVVSNVENKSKWSKIVKQNDEVKVIEAEGIFDGVLRQELHFEQHYLS